MKIFYNKEEMKSICFSPQTNENEILAAGSLCKISIYNIKELILIITLEGHKDYISENYIH